MAIISTVMPTFLLSQGIKRIGSGTASIIGTIGPVSTILLAWIFLGETLNLLQFLGTAFVIAGVFIVSYRR
jgi:drug/metabolite transporter (DMT)-like permease